MSRARLRPNYYLSDFHSGDDRLTRTGRKQLEGEVASYARLTEAIAKALQTA
ncbi:MAG TPA: hypothetical protein VFY40_29285 [Blastocatellia bacterium]|nr:hypothetical protein [Blastocatellia bacterium]